MTRKSGECIVIDTPEGRVTIMVVDVRGGNVRIGVSAPREMPVHRKEVQEDIDAGKKKPE